LHKTVDLGAVAFGHDVFVDLIANSEPFASVWAWETALLGKAETTVEGNPEHDFGVDEILFLVANFPDRHVGVCLR